MVGGVSGFLTAAVPVDWQLTDTYFVVAHLHYVLLGINVFPVVGGLFYWFPKFTGRMLDERLGKWGFWIMFIGFNLGFLPMHLAGLLGMPRRIYTYSGAMGWNTVNLVTSIGSFVFAVGVAVFAWNVAASLRRGAKAPADPWHAPTLEWSVPSPPPPYNFVVIPRIASRHPLWEEHLDEGMGRSQLSRGMLLDQGREILGTTPMDATPDTIFKMPGESLAPLFTALGATVCVVGALMRSVPLDAAGTAILLAALLAWLWPRRELGQTAASPSASEGSRS